MRTAYPNDATRSCWGGMGENSDISLMPSDSRMCASACVGTSLERSSGSADSSASLAGQAGVRTLFCEVKELWQGMPRRQFCFGVAQLVEEGVDQGFASRDPNFGVVD